MNLVGTFGVSVAKQPEKMALFWGERVYSYRELWGQTVLIHRQLQERFKLKRGDRVGLWLKNCPEFVPALFGILHAGAVAVPINNFLKPDEVNYILQDAGIDTVITDEDLAANLPALAAVRPSVRLFNVETLANENAAASAGHANGLLFANHKAKADELAVIIYTSGTTGRPKGAMLSHGNLLHNVE